MPIVEFGCTIDIKASYNSYWFQWARINVQQFQNQPHRNHHVPNYAHPNHEGHPGGPLGNFNRTPPQHPYLGEGRPVPQHHQNRPRYDNRWPSGHSQGESFGPGPGMMYPPPGLPINNNPPMMGMFPGSHPMPNVNVGDFRSFSDPRGIYPTPEAIEEPKTPDGVQSKPPVEEVIMKQANSTPSEKSDGSMSMDLETPSTVRVSLPPSVSKPNQHFANSPLGRTAADGNDDRKYEQKDETSQVGRENSKPEEDSKDDSKPKEAGEEDSKLKDETPLDGKDDPKPKEHGKKDSKPKDETSQDGKEDSKPKGDEKSVEKANKHVEKGNVLSQKRAKNLPMSLDSQKLLESVQPGPSTAPNIMTTHHDSRDYGHAAQQHHGRQIPHHGAQHAGGYDYKRPENRSDNPSWRGHQSWQPQNSSQDAAPNQQGQTSQEGKGKNKQKNKGKDKATGNQALNAAEKPDTLQMAPIAHQQNSGAQDTEAHKHKQENNRAGNNQTGGSEQTKGKKSRNNSKAKGKKFTQHAATGSTSANQPTTGFTSASQAALTKPDPQPEATGFDMAETGNQEALVVDEKRGSSQGKHAREEIFQKGPAIASKHQKHTKHESVDHDSTNTARSEGNGKKSDDWKGNKSGGYRNNAGNSVRFSKQRKKQQQSLSTESGSAAPNDSEGEKQAAPSGDFSFQPPESPVMKVIDAQSNDRPTSDEAGGARPEQAKSRGSKKKKSNAAATSSKDQKAGGNTAGAGTEASIAGPEASTTVASGGGKGKGKALATEAETNKTGEPDSSLSDSKDQGKDSAEDPAMCKL